MNRKINNLEELLLEKARLRAQMDIVQAEIAAGAQRTRHEFKTLLDEKLSLSKQLGSLFQGDQKTSVGSSALQTIGRVASGGSWWGGMAASLLPMVFRFVQKQLERRREKRQLAAATTEEAESAPPKPKGRKLFRRKKSTPDAPPA